MSTTTLNYFTPMNARIEWDNLQKRLEEYKIDVRIEAIAIAMVKHFEGNHNITQRIVTWIEKHFTDELTACDINYVKLNKSSSVAYLEFHFNKYHKPMRMFFLDYLPCEHNPKQATISLAIFEQHNNTQYCANMVKMIAATRFEDVEDLCNSWNTAMEQLQATHKAASMFNGILENRFALRFDDENGNGKIPERGY